LLESLRAALVGAEPGQVHEAFPGDAEPVAGRDDRGPGRAAEQAQHQVVGGEQQAAEVGHRVAARGQSGTGGAVGDVLEVGVGDAGPVALGRIQHANKRRAAVFQKVFKIVSAAQG